MVARKRLGGIVGRPDFSSGSTSMDTMERSRYRAFLSCFLTSLSRRRSLASWSRALWLGPNDVIFTLKSECGIDFLRCRGSLSFFITLFLVVLTVADMISRQFVEHVHQHSSTYYYGPRSPNLSVYFQKPCR